MLTVELAMKTLETLCREDFGELYRDNNKTWARFLYLTWIDRSYENIWNSPHYPPHDELLQELWDATEGKIGYGEHVPEHALEDWDVFKATLWEEDDDTAYYMQDALSEGVLDALLDTEGLHEAVEAKYGSNDETH